MCILHNINTTMADQNNNQYSFISLLKYRFNLDAEKAEEAIIIKAIKDNIEFKGTNLWTLIFAVLIASIGLNVNSTAVIIGAMLISPLMGPIMGIGLGLGIFDFQLIKDALKNLFVAVAISLIASTAYFFISPLHEARSELLARTAPTIWDVLIALFGGLAGIIASSRKNITNAIPGVAIATALMPPLCTAGYGLGTGNIYYFLGAFYLFLINCVFISISTFLIVRYLKFKPVHYVNEQVEKKMRKYIWGIAILTILPSVYLAYRFVEQEIFKQNAQNFINVEVKAKGMFVIDKNIDEREHRIELFVYGEKLNDSLSHAIAAKKKMYGLEKAEVVIEQTLNTEQRNKQTTTLKPDLSKELERQLVEKDVKINELNSQLNAQFQLADSAIYKEFEALYGAPKELIISRSIDFNENGRDTITLVYYSLLKRPKHFDRLQLEAWLKERIRAKRLKVTYN
jgi:uncharacterized hydrophobic protein (TIGR00271 family)